MTIKANKSIPEITAEQDQTLEIMYNGYRKWQMKIKGYQTCISFSEFKIVCSYLAAFAPLLAREKSETGGIKWLSEQEDNTDTK